MWIDIQRLSQRVLDHQDFAEFVPHFMGAIVLQNKDSAHDLPYDEARQVLVVDGQQRLKTLQLLIKAIQKTFETTFSDTSKSEQLQRFLYNDDKRTGGDYLNQTKIRQSNVYDQSEFQEVIRDMVDDNRPARAIVKGYEYFQGEVSNWLTSDAEDTNEKADALFKAITQYLKFASVILDTGEKPHFIFEILNTRGESLKQGDLIKNTLMYEADVVDDAQKARQLWGMFDADWWRTGDGRGRDPQIHLDRFLNYWMIMTVGENITIPRTASEFRSYMDDQKGPAVDDVAADIRSAGVVYRNIVEKRLPGIEESLKRIEAMEIGVVMPPLLWLFTQEIPEEERQRGVRVLESYLVRRMLCNIQSQGLNRLFIELVKHLDGNPGQPADEVLAGFLNGQSTENRIWPKDRRVIEYLTEYQMPGRSAARKKTVFDAIEIHIRPEWAEKIVLTENLTVEHLLPQGWKQAGRDWPLPKDVLNMDEAQQNRERYIDRIGNLTLATKELNSSMSNRSWTEKQSKLHEYSSLFLNKTLLDNPPAMWDEKSIDERSLRLAKAAIEIWPHIDGT